MKVLITNSAQSSVVDTEESHHNHNESTNWFPLHCVSRPGRSIVRKNTTKRSKTVAYYQGGRKEGVGSVPRYSG